VSLLWNNGNYIASARRAAHPLDGLVTPDLCNPISYNYQK
jgi:hypothetical protein